jgi:hypothetical protein
VEWPYIDVEFEWMMSLPSRRTIERNYLLPGDLWITELGEDAGKKVRKWALIA